VTKPEKYWSRISMRVSVSSTDAAHDALDRILPGIAQGVANKLGIKCKDVEIEHWLIIHNLEPDDE